MSRVGRKSHSADEDATVVLAGLAAAVIVLVAGTIGAAMARDDSGMHQFFAGQGDGGFRSAGGRASAAPPLTIHREPSRRIASHRPQLRFARAPRRGGTAVVAAAASQGARARPAVVSIYEDRTLRRGDAVMTTKGIRIFAGSKTFPYRPEDFRLLATLKQRTIPFRRALMELDRPQAPG